MAKVLVRLDPLDLEHGGRCLALAFDDGVRRRALFADDGVLEETLVRSRAGALADGPIDLAPSGRQHRIGARPGTRDHFVRRPLELLEARTERLVCS